jgi:hypothetical protein
VTSAAERPGFSLRRGVITFVLLSGVVLAIAVVLLLALDPRTQAFWAERWSELAAFVRSLFGR